MSVSHAKTASIIYSLSPGRNTYLTHIDEDVGSFQRIFYILIRQKKKKKKKKRGNLLRARTFVVSDAAGRMKETLINHNCQMLLFNHAVPEETQLCLVTKLLICSSLSLSLSRSLSLETLAHTRNSRTHARTLARARWSGGCQVISCTENQLTGASTYTP